MGMEHIATYIRPPWWKVPAIIEISTASKDKATKAHQQQLRQIPTEDLIIYTDGSSHNGHIGAAIYSPTTNVTKGEYIGTDETHNVYAAELTAIQMAVTEFEKRINKYTNVYTGQSICNSGGRLSKMPVRTVHCRGDPRHN